MTHLTLYGRGYFNRAAGVIRPPRRPLLNPYPEAQPTQAYPADDSRVVVEAIGALGDALSDAQRKERERVNTEAGDYRLPTVPKTRSEAIMAYILLARAAAAERPGSAAYFKTAANEAAYKYRNSPISNIIYAAVGLTDNAPRTYRLAKDVYADLPGAAAKPLVKPAAAANRGASEKRRVTPAPELPAVPEVPGDTWQDRLAMMPSWAPWLAGGVVVAVAAWLLLPSSTSRAAAAPAAAKP